MKTTQAATDTMSVFVQQETLKSEEDAKRLVRQAKTQDDFMGAKIFPPVRSGPKRWIVQVYYRDAGGKPPQGMARLTLPRDTKF